mmetsp:Transcript_26824/g.46556  ORF Transcript_26824/g.46556 Transcript_26824/m.46556 type:complete len:433 (-) Transcript_26824:51-1349(-)
MGNKSSSTCSCFEGLATIRTSLFGEDAYYRDNFERFRPCPGSPKVIGDLSPRFIFYDAEEGDETHDCLFQELKEQARLKSYKAQIWAGSMHAMVFHSRGQDDKREKSRDRPDCFETAPTNSLPKLVTPRDAWLGTTLRQWKQDSQPSRKEGPCWSAANGQNLKVRCGPNYRTNSFKTASKGSLYEAISCDAVKADVKIENVVGRLIPKLPDAPEGQQPAWSSGCRLPRIICINLMLPYQGGLSSLNPFGKEDAGCSFIGLFHVRPETLAALQSPKPPAAVKLLQKFCAGPAAAPGAPVTDPNRSLNNRVTKFKKKDAQSGLFKAMAYCDNMSSLSVPEMFHRFNGKPCLITKSGYIIRDPAGEWLEIGIDVRGFCTLALSMLSSFRHLLPLAKIHYGFLIQASEDEEMPEEILCDMSSFFVDMKEDPVWISA